MRLCHLKNKLITPSHFLQDHCYCCLPISMTKRPAVAVLFFFYLCHTKGNWFPLPPIKIPLPLIMIPHYYITIYFSSATTSSAGRRRFSFTVSARKLPCENKVAVPDQIQQLLFIEPSFQGHILNTSDQES